MSGRPGSWGLLGGVDPTPGRAEVLDHIATGLDGLAAEADAAAADLGGLGLDVGTSGWEGRTATSYTTAFAPTPGMMTTLAESYRAAGAALTGWRSTLEDLQAEADALLVRAEDAEARRLAAEDALPGARSARTAAKEALDDAAEDPDADTAAAFRRYDRAATRVWELEQALAEAEQDLQFAVEEAGELADAHRQATLGVAGEVAAATPDQLELLPFGVAVAAAAADAALPGHDAAGADGIISPAELARLLETGVDAALSEDLDPDGRAALERLLGTIADDEPFAGELVAEIGSDMASGLLYGMYHLGQYVDGADHRDMAEGFTAVLAAASQGAEGRAVLRDLTDPAEVGIVALLLASTEGLHPDLVVDVATNVIGDDDMETWPFHLGGSATFPDLYGGAVLVVVEAMAAQAAAAQEYFARTGEQGVTDLLDVPGYDYGVSEAVLTVVLAGLADGDPASLALAEDLVSSIAAHGAGDLDIQLGIIAGLAPHLAEVADDTFAQGAAIPDEVLEAFYTELLDGLSGEQVQAFVDVVVGVAVLDAGSMPIPTEQAVTIVDALKGELGELLGPLQDALEANELSVEQAQAAIASGVNTGVGLVNAVIGTVSPVGGLGGVAIKAVAKELTGIVGDHVASALSPDSIDAPDINEQAATIVNGVLPVLLAEPDVLAHVQEQFGASEPMPATAVEAYAEQQGIDLVDDFVVTLPDGSVVVVTENTWEILRNDLADILGAGWSA